MSGIIKSSTQKTYRAQHKELGLWKGCLEDVVRGGWGQGFSPTFPGTFMYRNLFTFVWFPLPIRMKRPLQVCFTSVLQHSSVPQEFQGILKFQGFLDYSQEGIFFSRKVCDWGASFFLNNCVSFYTVIIKVQMLHYPYCSHVKLFTDMICTPSAWRQSTAAFANKTVASASNRFLLDSSDFSLTHELLEYTCIFII